MPALDSNMSSNWEKIRQGVRDTELLISQKKYNLSMVKARQTLEYMVRDLCDKALVNTQGNTPDLSSLIDELYTNRWISKTTCEHFHKIRMLGNKAVHEGSENAYDANQAYHLLTQEVYTFSKDFRKDNRQTRSQQTSRTGGQPVRRRSASSGSGSNTRSRKRSADGFPLTSTDLMRILIVVIGIILIVAVIRLLRPSKSEPEATTPVGVETQAPDDETLSEPETTSVPETMAETTPAPDFVTTARLNVRSRPSTDGSVLGVLAVGTTVDYVETYDDEWVVINYEGSEAYVASRYLEHD